LDFDVGEGSSGDTHLANLRDVELITQWAAKAWRRHTGGKSSLSRSVNLSNLTKSNAGGSVSAQPQFMPPTPSTAGSSGSGGNAMQYQEDSPAGATVGISGVLDGPFSMQPLGPSNHDGSLRVSFNSAEADLSFPNSISTELFSIPDGLEEFLGSSMDTSGNGSGGGAELFMQSNALAGQGSLDHGMSIPAFSTLIGPWFPMGQFSRAPSPVHNGQPK